MKYFYTETEIEEDLEKKVKVLKWLVKNKMRGINQVGDVMAKNYQNRIKM